MTTRHYYDRRTLGELHNNRLRNRAGEYLDTLDAVFDTPPADDDRARAETLVRETFADRIHWMGWGTPHRLTAMVQADYYPWDDLDHSLSALGARCRTYHSGRLYETVQPHAGRHRF